MPSSKELFIGLDLGGTNLKYALGTRDGEILFKDKTPSKADQSIDVIFSVIFNSIQILLDKAKEFDGTVLGIGLGSPGAINFDKGKMIGRTPNIPNWIDADIRGQIEGKFDIPVWADNDANVMALAEARHGAAKSAKNIIAITLGTGIGGGILINNELYRGHNFAGAEIGHLSIDYDGESCNCGGTGCFEKYASAPAMVRHYLEKSPQNGASSKITTERIFAKAAEGEQEALQTIDETCEYLGCGLASVVNIFNPEMIVIGGGVADAGDSFMEQIRSAVEKRAMPATMKGLQIKRAVLGNDAGVVGAMSLAADQICEN